jgi:nucleoside-diphosphate-sugar epimerase
MRDNVVLVTGGAGYIGSHLVRKLLQRGYHVRVLDKFLYGEHGIADLRGDPNIELRYGDICNIRDVVQAVNGVGANGNHLLRENSYLNPVSLYARTRIMSEEVLLQEHGPVEVVILRLATVCGLSPRMRFDLMVNTITARASVEGRVRIVGANQWRPHIHVQDAAEAFLMAVEAPSSVAADQVYNVGAENLNFTVGEIADKVVEQIPGTVVEYFDRIEDRRSYRVGFDSIREKLGFVPARTVDDAIREVRTVLQTGEVRNYADEVYHNVKFLQRNSHQRLHA